jgi:hypothetical protein
MTSNTTLVAEQAADPPQLGDPAPPKAPQVLKAPHTLVWRLWLFLSLTATVGYFLLPTGGTSQLVLFVGLEAALLGALAVGVGRNRPTGMAFWKTLGASQVILLVAYVIWYGYPIVRKAELGFPSPSDPSSCCRMSSKRRRWCSSSGPAAEDATVPT